MNKSTIDVVRSFVAHVNEQERARQQAKGRGPLGSYDPSPDDKARRDSLMQDLLTALGMTKAELQTRLGIDKATWDRWRAMSSIPHRSYLEAMFRFATQQEKNDHYEETRPRPHEMLNARPHTWGRLRLVYSLFPWKNAVFNFKKPYYDPTTATEMALLALRGCNIVYLMQNADDWRINFTDTLVSVLGKNYAARALSRICIIKVSEMLPNDMPEFGLFNYEAKDPDDCVGYIWIEQGQPGQRPQDNADNQYSAFPASDDLVNDLRDKFWEPIEKAFREIDRRVPADFWSPTLDRDTRQDLLVIPIVHFPDPVDESSESR